MMKTKFFTARKTAVAALVGAGMVLASPAMAGSKLPAVGNVSTLAISPDTDPMIVPAKKPAYPTDALFNNVEGWAVVEMDIDETGKISDVEVIKSSNSQFFARHAARLIKHSRVVPAIKNGQPVAVNDYRLLINYKLQDSET